MKSTRFMSTVGGVVAAVCTCLPLLSCDWFRRAGPDVGDVLWVSPHQDHSWPQPAIDSTRVFVVDGTGALRAVARVNGHEAWRTQLAQRPFLTYRLISARGMVVAGTDGLVFGVDGRTGQMRWQYVTPVDSERPPLGPGSLGGTRMHADSSTVYLPAAGGTITALDIVSGAPRWTWRWRGAEGKRRGTNSVRVQSDTLYAVGWEYVDDLGGRSGGWITALDVRTGQQLWSRSFPAVTSGVGAEGQPAVHGDLVLMTLPGGIVMALDRNSGATRWERASTAIRGTFSQVELWDGVVYFDGGDKHVHALDARTGAEIWRSRYGLQSLRDLVVTQQQVAISAQQ